MSSTLQFRELRASSSTRLSVAIVTIIVAMCVKLHLQFILTIPISYFILISSIAVSTWIAGGRSGILATAFAAAIAAYSVFVAPSPLTPGQHLLGTQAGLFVVFLIIGALVSIVGLSKDRIIETLDREQAKLNVLPLEQQAFLRNLLHTATNGKLHLCFAESELPSPAGPQSGHIPLMIPSQVSE